eukprot:gene9806-33049_t
MPSVSRLVHSARFQKVSPVRWAMLGQRLQWKEIGRRAFLTSSHILSAPSSIILDNATALETVGSEVFTNFEGHVSAKGTYRSLKSCTIVPGGEDVPPKATLKSPEAIMLTQELHKQGPAAYKNASCIPNNAFYRYERDVTLENMEELVSVGDTAFLGMSGTLTFAGKFPKLAEIRANAFRIISNGASSVSLLEGGAALETVEQYAFYQFQGLLSFAGSFPNLKEVGSAAFSAAGTARFGNDPTNSILLDDGAAALEVVEGAAFQKFAGKLTFAGSFPKLREVGTSAFDTDNVDSVLAITCRGDTWTVSSYSFDGFS